MKTRAYAILEVGSALCLPKLKSCLLICVIFIYKKMWSENKILECNIPPHTGACEIYRNISEYNYSTVW
jgi:hypothetical protein